MAVQFAANERSPFVNKSRSQFKVSKVLDGILWPEKKRVIEDIGFIHEQERYDEELLSDDEVVNDFMNPLQQLND